eukprot:777773-Prymnesium_polylepis.1
MSERFILEERPPRLCACRRSQRGVRDERQTLNTASLAAWYIRYLRGKRRGRARMPLTMMGITGMMGWARARL